MALKEKEGKSQISELKPWPTYIEVRLPKIIIKI